MAGVVFKRKLPSGRITWAYQLELGRDDSGKRLRDFKSGFARKIDAEEDLRKAVNAQAEGKIVKPDPSTFEHFMNEWFREYAEKACAPKTVERYRQLAAYVMPHIGAVRLQQLSALTLQRVFNLIHESGGRDRITKKMRPLSAKTVRHVAGLVHTALATAIEWGLINHNPCLTKNLPRVEKREARTLDAQQLAWYADAARTCGLFEFLMLAAATGCRRGELLALAWSDIDFTTKSLRIVKSLEQTKKGVRPKETKNTKSRVISLPTSTTAMLQQLRAAQEKRRVMFAQDYRCDLNLVFCTPEGNYLKPDSVSAKASIIAKRVGLKDTSIHTLRHSHGSQLLSANVPLPTVSKRLGHSSPYVTATIYSHALSKDEAMVGEIWDATVNSEIDRDRKSAKIS